jgi:hypothetical protein
MLAAWPDVPTYVDKEGEGMQKIQHPTELFSDLRPAVKATQCLIPRQPSLDLCVYCLTINLIT